MKFLLDVCASSRSLQAALTEWGHDVISAVTIDRQASDEQVLALALAKDRILVTEDKDFGELVFVQKRLHGTIVRLVEMSVAAQVVALGELLEQHADELTAKSIITVSLRGIRIRRLGA
jgi:predicted nuclease of predicted toxin-antitoxin system